MAIKNFMNLTEDQARNHLEKVRWPHGPNCPHCGDLEVAKLKGKATRPGLYKCKGPKCRKQFTVTVGSIFEGSHIPLSKWIAAFYLVCCSKKGISALQLQRMLDLKSYKSAWHLAHRIRWAMRHQPFSTLLLQGTVEVDETWVGPRRRKPNHSNDWQANKTAVVALIERKGDMRTQVYCKVTKENLRSALTECVDKRAVLMTDELQAYKKITHDYKDHQTVNHTDKEYARGSAHVNTAESFFALLKRGIHGSFHHVSKHHLHRYCDEFSFRWNYRGVSDDERTMAALIATTGKRLTYKTTAS